MKKIMLILSLLGSALMAQNGPLANGVYAVEEGKAKEKNLVVRQYEGKDVVLDTANFAPLVSRGQTGDSPGPARQLADDPARARGG